MTSDLTYGFERTLPGTTVGAAIDRVTAALAAEGFGVLTRIDVQDTLKKKLELDFRAYVILGACNPRLAHRAITTDPRIGLLLPCNVVIEETAAGAHVAIADPTAMFQLAESPALEPVAREAHERLRRVYDALA